MSWLKEANQILYSKYGGYCSKCKLKGVRPIPFTKWKKEYLDNIQK